MANSKGCERNPLAESVCRPNAAYLKNSSEPGEKFAYECLVL